MPPKGKKRKFKDAFKPITNDKPKKTRSSNTEGGDTKTAPVSPSKLNNDGVDQHKSLTDQYTNLSHREHILKLSDTYIGTSHLVSVESLPVIRVRFADDDDDKKTPIYTFEKSTLKIVPGLQKIFDEILNNAFDNVARTRFMATQDPETQLCTLIKVGLKPDDNCISVWNNGSTIPVLLKQLETKTVNPNSSSDNSTQTQQTTRSERIYVPEMVFGRLLTSSNYNTQNKMWGGRNGYGAKLTSIYSTKFQVEIGDSRHQRFFKQTWVHNMSPPHKPPVIKPYTKKNSYIKVTFWPDLRRFDIPRISEDMVALMRRRVFDVAGCTPASVKVYLNNRVLKVRDFKHYISTVLNPHSKCYFYTVGGDEKNDTAWTLGVTHSPTQTFQQMSWVNGIFTAKGGKHVDYVVMRLVRNLTDMLNKKRGSSKTFKSYQVRNNLFVFLNCYVPDPTFDSQTKEYLTTAYKDLGVQVGNLDEKWLDRILRGEIGEMIRQTNQVTQDKNQQRSDGRMVKRVHVPKLDDANKAGGRESHKCTLILTEGDSAKTMVLSGISIIGRDYYGVYPLKGKVLNVQKRKSANNEEINHLKQILGLKQNQTFEDEDGQPHKKLRLRYGRVLIMTDQDPDGSHIRGLLLNLFGQFWPSLLKRGFVRVQYTPAVKVSHRKKVLHTFYSLVDYVKWCKTNPPETRKNLTIKHYKGLGTSLRTETQEYFKNPHISTYVYDDEALQSLQLAFGQDASVRKAWLDKRMEEECKAGNNMEEYMLDYNETKVSVTDFINKELVHFSYESIKRAVPSFCDGFKSVQRKIIFTVLDKNITTEKRVFILGGIVTTHTAYHHGDISMANSIINLAQNFVGSSNINLLVPLGHFGTRVMGGMDHSSPRYIFTHKSPILNKIIRVQDTQLLQFKYDEGKRIEPQWFLPIIPLVLIMGPKGIGTGYSTSFPQFNPKDVIGAIQDLLDERTDPSSASAKRMDLVPWYRNFKGSIHPVPDSDGEWFVDGIWSFVPPNKIEITELPVQTWTTNYEEFLDKWVANQEQPRSKTTAARRPQLKYYTKHNYHNDIQVYLILEFENDDKFRQWIQNDEHVMKDLKIRTKLTSNNMHALSPMGRIVRFKSVHDLIHAFFKFRLPFYQQYRNYKLKLLRKEMLYYRERERFIRGILERTVTIQRKTNQEVWEELNRHKFIPNPLQQEIQLLPVPVKYLEYCIQDHISKPIPIKYFEGFTEWDLDHDASAASSQVDTFISSDDDSAMSSEPEFELDPTTVVSEQKKVAKSDNYDLKPYHYLIRMPMDSMTQHHMDNLRDQTRQATKEYSYYLNAKAEDLWRYDLEELEAEWEQMVKQTSKEWGVRNN